ncbi:MAG: glycosyltransferase, partial [Rudaea sp.]
ADHIAAECPQDEEDLINLYNADPGKISIVPAGFDPGEFWPINKVVARIALGLAPEDKVVLQLGRMVKRKGVDNVIQGFARLLSNHKMNAHLLIVGGESDDPDPERTPEIGRLLEIAREAGIEDHVTFVGRRGRDALKYYYSAADIFVSTPWYEPFGITPLEAMACGTPVIGSNVGGIKFTVRDGETGYLVPANDPAAMGERLAHLLRQPKLLSVFRRQAIKRANDLFTWQHVTTGLATLYEDVIASLQPARPAERDYTEIIEKGFDGAIESIQRTRSRLRNSVMDAADLIGDAFTGGHKLLICGNGGSAADAQHFAGEFVGRFKTESRGALPAIALNADTSVMTGWANDIGYEDVFARQVEAYAQPGDVLVGISTSGRSHNLLRAFEIARKRGAHTIAILGRDGGDLRLLADLSLIIPSEDTQHIQETHIVVIHLLCELVEARLPLGPISLPDESPAPNLWEAPVEAAPRRNGRLGTRR